MSTYVLIPSTSIADDFVSTIQRLCVDLKEIIKQIPDTHPRFLDANKISEQIYVATKPLSLGELIKKINVLSDGVYYVRDHVAESSLADQIKLIDISLFQLSFDVVIRKSIDIISRMYADAIPTCPTSYKIYVDLIMHNGGDLNLLHRMKDHTICVSGDPIDDIKQYQSIQLMTYTPNIITVNSLDSALEDPVVDIRFTQTASSYVYDVRRLTTKKTAISYGPILTSMSGINYKLTQRMDTFQSTPMNKLTKQSIRLISADGVSQVDIGQPGTMQVSQPGVWGILGGSHPRVSRLNMIESELIMHSIRNTRISWPTNIGQQYNAREYIPDACAETKLVKLISDEIFTVYDIRPALNYAEFYSIVFGDSGFSPESYICNVLSKLGYVISSSRLSTALIRNPTWNANSKSVSRETALSQCRQSIDAGKELYRRMRLNFRCDSSIFALPEIQKRYKLMSLIKSLVASAVNSEPLICSELTIAEYAATRHI
jgi:hypothetical protein